MHRFRGSITFSYLADPNEYNQPATTRQMASSDEQDCYDDLASLFRLLDAGEDIDISIVPAVAAVPDLDDWDGLPTDEADFDEPS